MEDGKMEAVQEADIFTAPILAEPVIAQAEPEAPPPRVVTLHLPSSDAGLLAHRADFGAIATALDASAAGLKKGALIALVGAGISTAASIPDFRSSNGLYALAGAERDPSPLLASTSDAESSQTSTHPAATSESASQASSSSSFAPSQPMKRIRSKGADLFSASSHRTAEGMSAHLRFLGQLKTACDRVAATGTHASRTHQFLGTLKSRHSSRLRVYSQNIDEFETLSGLRLYNLDRERRTAEKGKAKEQPGEVVALHGSINLVRCSSCSYSTAWTPEHTALFLEGSTAQCPSCAARVEERELLAKRAIPCYSFLRPDIVLYDDSASSNAEAIAKVSLHDVNKHLQCVLVMGTSLQVKGLKSLVRQFAKKARACGGVVVYVNREPLGREWETVFDYQVIGDSDTFVDVVQQLWEDKRKERRRELAASRKRTQSQAQSPTKPIDTTPGKKRVATMPLSPSPQRIMAAASTPQRIALSALLGLRQELPCSP